MLQTRQVQSDRRLTKQQEDDTITNMRTYPVIAVIVLLLGSGLVAAAMAASISIGVREISIVTVWEALTSFQADNNMHQIINSIRVPRALAGGLVGAAFAVSGAIMQGMTRNPLASPDLLGVSAGASFVLVLVFAFFPALPFELLILFSFIGAGLGAGLVYGIAYFTRGGLSPLKLVLAGAVIGALLSSLSQALTIVFQLTYDLTFWSAGGISTVEWFQVKVMLPWLIVGIIVAILISRYITVLSLGEDIATGLGQRTKLIKGLGTIVVLVLTGASVATVGGVGFVGLVVPHIVRGIVGVDYRWIIPCSAVIGALLVIVADIAAKTVNMPYETPLGALMAVIGVPFFLYLARKERREL